MSSFYFKSAIFFLSVVLLCKHMDLLLFISIYDPVSDDNKRLDEAVKLADYLILKSYYFPQI